jgi:hypothetical protein
LEPQKKNSDPDNSEAIPAWYNAHARNRGVSSSRILIVSLPALPKLKRWIAGSPGRHDDRALLSGTNHPEEQSREITDPTPIRRRQLRDWSVHSRPSRTDLVRRFGYRGLTSGHGALSRFFLTGIVPPFVRTKLASVLEVEEDLIDNLLLATARQRHDETGAQILAKEDAHRAAFRPYLQVQTERRNPSPIFIAALLTTRRLRIVPLPDETLSADDDTQDPLIKAVIIFGGPQRHGRAFPIPSVHDEAP